MLSIRMKRLGRKGHPTYRVVVQDSRQSPTSGKYVALLGSYDPHTKHSTLVKDKAEFYLKHGAQPSERVVSLFKEEKITLPKWVKKPAKKSKSLRNPDKLRRNRPADSPPKAADPEENATAPEDADKPAEATAEPPAQAEAAAPAAEEAIAAAETQPEEPQDDGGNAPETAAEDSKPENTEEETDADNKS